MIKFDKKTIIIISVIAVIIILVIIVLVRSRKQKSDNPADVTNVVSNPVGFVGGISKSSYVPESYPLAKGMQGVNIKNLQREYNRRGYELKEDGFFGTFTEEATEQVLGKKTVTQSDITFLENEKVNTGDVTQMALSPNISTENGVNQYAYMLYDNLVNKVIAAGRDASSNSSLFGNFLAMSDVDFKKIVTAYRTLYNRDLAKDIDTAYFKLTTSVDEDLIVRIRTLMNIY